jgi:Fe-S cluster biogenesis protein NfuA
MRRAVTDETTTELDQQADAVRPAETADTAPSAGATFDPGGPEPGTVPALSEEDVAERMGALTSIIDLMRPAVQADGGDLVLVNADVIEGVVEVELQGACSSCAISSSTLQQGVERILRDRLAWVTEVRGGVDESLDPLVSGAMGRGGYVPGY